MSAIRDLLIERGSALLATVVKATGPAVTVPLPVALLLLGVLIGGGSYTLDMALRSRTDLEVLKAELAGVEVRLAEHTREMRAAEARMAIMEARVERLVGESEASDRAVQETINRFRETLAEARRRVEAVSDRLGQPGMSGGP